MRASSRLRVSVSLSVRSAHVLAAPGVNQHHIPDYAPPLELRKRDNCVDTQASVSRAHWSGKPWSCEAVRTAEREHVVSTWVSGNAAANLPLIVRAEGVHLFDETGKRYLDWTSQAVCTNLGHDVPDAVIAAVVHQLQTVPMVYGGLGMTEVRCRMAQLMAEILPADLNGVLFPLGGSEANEAAIRIARRFTGKHKVLAHYRSYHGGTANSLAATGDFRRNFLGGGNGGGSAGFVHFVSPLPVQMSWGESEEAASAAALAALEEVIMLEGPSTIAALIMESVTGSGGVLIASESYMQGLRALCDKYDIVYIADEVMVGFGRTGKLWGFQHFEGVVPDIVTSAKGLSASFMPLAMVAMRRHIQEFFEKQPLGWGATYHAHPVALACGYEVVKNLISEDLPAKAKALEPVMVEELSRLVQQRGSVKQARNIGLFGCLDLVDAEGRPAQALGAPMTPPAKRLKAAMLEHGLIGLFRPPLLHCAPPLVISEPELRDGFARLGRALEEFERALGIPG